VDLGVGTALAAVGAVAAVIIALFQLQDQEHARQQEQAAALAQAERAQAAQVSAWPYATQPWVRSASGSLYRIGRPAAEYYGVPQPAGWGMPTQTQPS
jgi:type II secretory pathway pseudopilin PulG